MKPMRAAFEKDVADECWDNVPYYLARSKKSPDEYEHPTIQTHWLVWQDAWNAACKYICYGKKDDKKTSKE